MAEWAKAFLARHAVKADAGFDKADALAKRIAAHLAEYCNLGFNRKPEHMCAPWVESLPPDFKARLAARYAALADEEDAIETLLDDAQKDRYFRLYGYTVRYLAESGKWFFKWEGDYGENAQAAAKDYIYRLNVRWHKMEGGRLDGFFENPAKGNIGKMKNHWNSHMQWPWNETQKADYYTNWRADENIEWRNASACVATQPGAEGGRWVSVRGLGTSGSAMALWPVKPGVGKGATLDYALEAGVGDGLVLQFLPDYELWPGVGLRVEVEVNGGEKTIVDVPAHDSNLDAHNKARGPLVMDNFVRAEVPGARLSEGVNKIRITAVSPGVAVDKIGIAKKRCCANPVWAGDFPDPTTWRADDGTYRATSTALTILKSRDFRCWEPTGKRVFTRADEKRIRQKWKNIWAPDVFRLGDEYLIYVSLVNCDTNSAIAVYSSKDPEGPFKDGRIITRSIDTGIRDTIDPEVVRDDRDGALWLFFGSTGKMHRVKLSPDGKSLSPDAKYEHVAGLWGNENDDPARKRIFEAAYLHRRNGWWYLFVSRGFYANHTYSIAVGRATTLDGPFLDRKGRKMTDGFATKVIASKKGDRFFGPGHNGEIVTVDGHDYITFHCHVAGEHSKDRPLFVAELTWDAADWPYVESLK